MYFHIKRKFPKPGAVTRENPVISFLRPIPLPQGFEESQLSVQQLCERKNSISAMCFCSERMRTVHNTLGVPENSDGGAFWVLSSVSSDA